MSNKPGPDSQFDKAADCRLNTTTGAPTCVHPYRVGLPAASYASQNLPIPDITVVRDDDLAPTSTALALSAEDDDLEGWLVAHLTVNGASAQTIEMAETLAGERFPADRVVEALRQVLSYRLATERLPRNG
ncbi:hypothetical protein [Salininema proteolyticum]|uniref:Uncharacterized protein n=1 Tax=Salininema proteolyticum TaxID=1607685 RepID=A0ABV8U4I3_9ACTN